MEQQHWNGEHLPETLVKAWAWRESEHYLPYDFEADRALAEAIDRLFAQPEPAPRSAAEQAVLDAAKAWWERDSPRHVGQPSGALFDACERLWHPAPSRCDAQPCENAGTQTVVALRGRRQFCPQHAVTLGRLLS